MKSFERVLAIAVALIAIGGFVQAAALLPYRMEKAEQTQREQQREQIEALKEVRAQADLDRVKANEVKEIVVRVEERLKGVQSTVDAMDRRQRFTGVGDAGSK